MSKPANAKGTRDFASSEVRKRKYLFDTIIRVYENFGFEPLETPALENIETLTGKYGDEGDQLLFRVLRSGDFLARVEDDILNKSQLNALRAKVADKGLRYDLTIPFARFVAKNHQEIGLPFKRYQIQPVWRADRPAKGRYREFYQCDADVVGTDSLISDSEFMLIIDEVFMHLGLPRVTIHLNNRKVLFGIAESLGIQDRFVPMTTSLDKLDKIGIDGVRKDLTNRGFSANEIDGIEAFLNIEGSNQERIGRLAELFANSATGTQGLNELSEMLNVIRETKLTHSDLNVNFTLARGLSYYTGSIYEVTLNGVDMGSVASGGRYDDLTGVFGLKGVPGVGLSFGAERIYDVMEQMNLFPTSSLSSIDVLFMNLGEKAASRAFSLVHELRKLDFRCDLYPKQAKLNKQFKFAEKRGARFVAIIGDEELESGKISVKNQETGEQQSLTISEFVDILK